MTRASPSLFDVRRFFVALVPQAVLARRCRQHGLRSVALSVLLDRLDVEQNARYLGLKRAVVACAATSRVVIDTSLIRSSDLRARWKQPTADEAETSLLLWNLVRRRQVPLETCCLLDVEIGSALMRNSAALHGVLEQLSARFGVPGVPVGLELLLLIDQNIDELHARFATLGAALDWLGEQPCVLTDDGITLLLHFTAWPLLGCERVDNRVSLEAATALLEAVGPAGTSIAAQLLDAGAPGSLDELITAGRSL